MRLSPLAASAACLYLLAFGPLASAASWNETTNGDISGNRLAPTSITLSLGDNRVSGSLSPTDLDYLHFNVPVGQELSFVFLESFTGGGVSFIGMQRGTIFDVAPDSAGAPSLIGYAHYGSSDVGTDILFPMAIAPGAQSFSTPARAGDYTIWLQEFNGTSRYTFNFYTTPVVPAPGAAGMLLISAGMLARRRR